MDLLLLNHLYQQNFLYLVLQITLPYFQALIPLVLPALLHRHLWVHHHDHQGQKVSHHD